MGIIRKVRFFVSWLLFEYILGWEIAEITAQKIISDVDESNKRAVSRPQCLKCHGGSFTTPIIVGRGRWFFSHEENLYQQAHNGSFLQTEHFQFPKYNLVKDGGRYRYRMANGSLAWLCSALLPGAGTVLAIFMLLYFLVN